MTRYTHTPAVVFGAFLIATLAWPSSAQTPTQTQAPAQAQPPTHVLDTDYVLILADQLPRSRYAQGPERRG